MGRLRNVSLLFIVCAAIGIFPFEVRAGENIRVAILDDQRSVAITSTSGLVIAGKPSRKRISALMFRAATLGKRPVRVSSLNKVVLVNGTSYRGWVELRKKTNGLLLVVNDLDLEDYLKGVIAAEVPPNWEIDALKAQAVASRTYALNEKRRYGNRPYHILATIDSQMYSGVRSEYPKAVLAVIETKGLVLVHEGKLIPAFYHANCGGHTENASELWGIDAPYLKGVDCECQRILKSELWEKRFTIPQFLDTLKRAGYPLSDISDISVASVTPAGRVKNVALRSKYGSTIVPAEILRSALGSTVVPSLFFELELTDGEVVFSGRGKGHGVGLCQWGAHEMAGQGHDFRSILLHYYPGTLLMKMESH